MQIMNRHPTRERNKIHLNKNVRQLYGQTRGNDFGFCLSLFAQVETIIMTMVSAQGGPRDSLLALTRQWRSGPEKKKRRLKKKNEEGEKR